MKKTEKQIKEKDIIKIIYQGQEEIIDKKIMKINKQIANEIKDINIEKLIENSESGKELEEIFNKIEENYSIRISKYNEEIYRQGFIDGINLMLNCHWGRV